MEFSDIDHYATMLAGCESINNGVYNTPDARYAQSVLRLHANDAGIYAGQEGFLDAIKTGARKTKEWIEKALKAIKQFFTTIYKKIRGNLKVALHGGREKFAGDMAKTSFGTLKTIDKGLIDLLERYGASLRKAGHADKFTKLSELAGKLDNSLGEHNVNLRGFLSDLEKLMDGLQSLFNDVQVDYEKSKRAVPSDQSADNYSALANYSLDLGWSAASVGGFSSSIAKAANSWTDKVLKESGQDTGSDKKD